MLTVAFLGILAALAAAWARRQLHRRGLSWLVPYIAQTPRRRAPRPADEVHLILCIADHYEPCGGGVSPETALARVGRWGERYPQLFGDLRDSDGRPPRHTFFVPLEEYVPEHLDGLAALCARGFGEVEVHLHHDHDTADALRAKLLTFKALLAQRHGLLCRHRHTGELAYGFIHGNWALDNSRPDGRWCGVNNELDVLRETGCYADFTLPSAPAPAQTRKINSIYYAVDDPLRPMSHDTGTDVDGRPAPANALMLIQGPLLLDWRRRKWGVCPRLENGCLQGNQLPSLDRLSLWLRARVQLARRPDWYFVKLHTHGAKEANQAVLLDEPMRRFHEALATHARRQPRFHYHYVTAREMYNLVRAAEAGWTGTVEAARDFELIFNGRRSLALADTFAAPTS